ncbi:hypothetical protein GF318_02885 [Candidatus Micrarchaeota archaeon]|nr:hypothetical protein [Candidatus Micrarchaeota archaeon]
MADCIVFSAAKKADENSIPRLSGLSSEALAAGVPFTVVADVVYYNTPDVSADTFAARCIATSVKQNKPLNISQVRLRDRLANI